MEDLKVLLYYGLALDEGTPILIRSNYWDAIMVEANRLGYYQQSLYGDENISRSILSPKILVRRHPFLFYEPPELFHFLYPRTIITQALGGDKIGCREFKTQIKQANEFEKIERIIQKNISPFYIPFIERQFKEYLMDNNLDKLANIFYDDEELKKTPHVYRAWSDKRVDETYPAHIAHLLLEAKKAKNSALIPPVPMIQTSSKNSDILRVYDFNIASSIIRKELGDNMPHVYFHLYIDWKVIVSEANTNRIYRLIENVLEDGDFGGICLTINGYKNAITKFDYLEEFISEVSAIAEYYYLPLILPRSKWYGLKLTDNGVNGFSSLLNGKFRYSKRPRRYRKGEINEFGTTYIINESIELNYNDTIRYLQKYKGFPKVYGLPTFPKQEYLKKPSLYRIHVSKPRRLSHIEEARYIRKGITKGVIGPATRYLEKSHNPDFGTR